MKDIHNIHWNILDEKRKSILPLMKDFADMGFYLAGGTGLALQLGHRDSIDFDFFKEGGFDLEELERVMSGIFENKDMKIFQKEKNTLSLNVSGDIKLSFFGYKYPLVKDLVKTEYFSIASISDIACMKLSAITSRNLEKDYIDLYFILKNFTLGSLLEDFQKKYTSIDVSVLLKSLVYFDDIIEEPILFKEDNNVSMKEVENFLRGVVKDYLK